MEEMDTAVLESSMDDLLEEVTDLRKHVDRGFVGELAVPGNRKKNRSMSKSPKREWNGGISPKRESPKRERQVAGDHSKMRADTDLKEPPIALPKVGRPHASPPRGKGSIIGELRRAGLSVALPGQRKETHAEKYRSVAPPALRDDDDDDDDEYAQIHLEDRNRYPSSRDRQKKRGKSKSPKRIRGSPTRDEIQREAEEEERREGLRSESFEREQQAAAEQLYREAEDALAEPWVDKGATASESASGSSPQKQKVRETSSMNLENNPKKKPHGQVTKVSKKKSKKNLLQKPSMPTLSESYEEDEAEAEALAEERRIKMAMKNGNADEVKAALLAGGGGGGPPAGLFSGGGDNAGAGGMVLAKAGGSGDSSDSDRSPKDPAKMAALQADAITHKEYVESTLKNTGFNAKGPEPSFMRPVEKKTRGRSREKGSSPKPAYEDEVAHVQEVLSRSSKLRTLRDQKAAAKRERTGDTGGGGLAASYGRAVGLGSSS